jgi:RND family efflux transporter MFP subunit
MYRWIWFSALLGLAPLLTGCQQQQAAPPAASKPAELQVSQPVVRVVTDYEFFTGRTEASDRTDLRSRVSGYLDKILFTDGATVKAGEVLFEIDPRPFQAQLDQDKADLLNRKAVAIKTEAIYKRGLSLLSTRASSREDVEVQLGDWEVAKAGVEQAEAKVRASQLNLEYTKVRAPFAGIASRRMIDRGNIVKADDTILTTLVTADIIWIYFDVDERTLLRQFLRTGELTTEDNGKLTVHVGLVDEDGYPHKAEVNFVDNKLDPGTGSLWMRAAVTRPGSPADAASAESATRAALWPFRPGMFARIRVPIGAPHEALLVSEQALGTDQGQKFVYVVSEKKDESGNVMRNEKGEPLYQADQRPVKIGRLHDGYRAIREGLKPGEMVVVSGMQRIRPGATVTPKSVPMPTLVVKGTEAESDHKPEAALKPDAHKKATQQ